MPRLKKKYSQNFLTNGQVIDQIVHSADLSVQDNVLEIGPGSGLLTQALLPEVHSVTAVEVDQDWYEYLQKKFKHENHLKLILGNFLDLSESVFKSLEKVKVVANLPYHITTPVIEKLFQYLPQIESMTLMVQKEVAQRIVAVQSARVGLLSLFVQLNTVPQWLFEVSKNDFNPVPQVDSAVIQLIPRFDGVKKINDHSIYLKLVKAAFWGKRKTICNSLTQAPYFNWKKEEVQALLNQVGIDPGVRAEKVSLEQYITLANQISSL